MMSDQRTLFPQEPPIARRTDPETSHEAARRLINSGRRGSQKARILARLREGPATNAELAALCLKYTGRISDLRADGHRIRCIQRGPDGLAIYHLEEER